MQEDLLEQANAIGKNTLLENFEISFIEVGKDYLIAQMPVTEKNCQINGILHGGASAALAETVGSMASVLLANPDKQLVLGTDITMNQTFWVGIYPALGEEHLDYIAEKLEEYFGVNF